VLWFGIILGVIKGSTISVIIPAFNEEKTVGGVVEPLLKSRKIDEIICVNDGSSDRTAKVLKKFGKKIILIDLNKNFGKGYALAKGIEKTNGEVVVFIDSDLIGVKPEHIGQLVNPLTNGDYKIVLGSTGGTRKFGIYAAMLTGERAYWRKDLIPLLPKFRNSRLGVETYLNHVFKKAKRKMVDLDVIHLEKYEKLSSFDASMSYIQEGVEIIRERAKIIGAWNPKVSRQLKKIALSTSWREFKGGVAEIADIRLRRRFESFIQKYSGKIKAFLEE